MKRLIKIPVKSVILVTLICLSQQSFSKDWRSSEFPADDIVKDQADFWYLIFSRFHSDQAVIHDLNHPNLIIDVIDFAKFSKKYNQGKPYTKTEKSKIIDRYLARYNKAIAKLRRAPKRRNWSNAMEQRVFEVYRSSAKGYLALRRGKAMLRVQTGLADEFKRASQRASLYLPYMERIFRNHGLPVELTRIVFVESMFNPKALSKVGASGVWQFMPETAKDYMLVNHFVDERNSPLKATEAAARFLKYNFRVLKSWPLAITAYNHGANGMKRAVRKTGSKDLSEIIKKYQSPSFGFASKNFFAEFIAAKAVYEDFYSNQSNRDKNPLNLTQITLPRAMSVNEIIRKTPLNEDLLKKYNGCLKPSVFRKHRYSRLPKSFQILVPNKLAQQVRSGINSSVISQSATSRRRS